MGLANRQPQSTFVTASDGKIRVRLDGPCEGSESRKITMGESAGKEIHEMLYDQLDGFLRRVELREGKYGDQWQFVIEDADDGSLYTLQFAHISASAQRVINQLCSPEFNAERPISIRPYKFKSKEGKEIVGVNVYQGEKLPFAYGTNAKPIEGRPEMPDWEAAMLNGKTIFDKTKTLEFLANAVATVLAPKVNAAHKSSAAHVPVASTEDAPKVEAEEFDDVPF